MIYGLTRLGHKGSTGWLWRSYLPWIFPWRGGVFRVEVLRWSISGYTFCDWGLGTDHLPVPDGGTWDLRARLGKALCTRQSISGTIASGITHLIGRTMLFQPQFLIWGKKNLLGFSTEMPNYQPGWSLSIALRTGDGCGLGHLPCFTESFAVVPFTRLLPLWNFLKILAIKNNTVHYI